MYRKGQSALGGMPPGHGGHFGPDAAGDAASARHSSSGHHHRHGHYLQAPGPSQALHSPRGHGFPHVMHRHHRGHHRGQAKYAWALIGGLALFLGLFFLLYPPGRAEVARMEHLTGHLLVWPGLLLVLSGLFSLAVMLGFRLGTDPVTRETALRHYVGRKLIKLGLVSAMFWGGWLLGWLVALLLSMGHG